MTKAGVSSLYTWFVGWETQGEDAKTVTRIAYVPRVLSLIHSTLVPKKSDRLDGALHFKLFEYHIELWANTLICGVLAVTDSVAARNRRLHVYGSRLRPSTLLQRTTSGTKFECAIA